MSKTKKDEAETSSFLIFARNKHEIVNLRSFRTAVEEIIYTANIFYDSVCSLLVPVPSFFLFLLPFFRQ